MNLNFFFNNVLSVLKNIFVLLIIVFIFYLVFAGVKFLRKDDVSAGSLKEMRSVFLWAIFFLVILSSIWVIVRFLAASLLI